MEVNTDLLLQLSTPQQPLMQALGLAALGLWCQWHGHRHAARLCLVLGVCWVGLCATPAFSDWMRYGLESRHLQSDAKLYPTVDAIVVLGGDFKSRISAGTGCSHKSLHSKRVDFGYALYRATRTPLILLSGGDGEAESMAWRLACIGVPISALMLESNSTDTRQNAINSAPLLRHVGAHRILLVTSPIHMPRASAAFRNVGIEVIPAPATESRQLRGSTSRLWHPVLTLLRSGQALKEYGGMVYYWLRGWL